MRKIRCLVVDDEELARTLLAAYIHRLPHLELVGQCRDSLQALQTLQAQPIDLLFLDIQMPELTGIELLRSLVHKPLVIFTTAYPDYALEGYQLDVVDYLLKPFGFDRFLQAVNRASDLLRLQWAANQATLAPDAEPPTEDPKKDFLLVRSEHKIHRIRFEDIRFVQSMREYVAFYTPAGRILSLNSLKSLEEELPSDRFLRIHKSYIVAIDKVETLEGNMLIIDSEKLPIGASYRDEVMRRLFNEE